MAIIENATSDQLQLNIHQRRQFNDDSKPTVYREEMHKTISIQTGEWNGFCFRTLVNYWLSQFLKTNLEEFRQIQRLNAANDRPVVYKYRNHRRWLIPCLPV